ncbi:hypothetical protein LCGC14_0156990 [marine sediment metagenome]|uniref:Acyltransferase 3 domain-containing protein n=1 Tax=marine sediment metagenome TaxID=412755 RepID=A0A0F9UX22_9ZZZZ
MAGLRNDLIDNAKAGLIFLVVLGHFLEEVGGWTSPFFRMVLTAIYIFHMPAFVFLSGITAKQDNLILRVARLAVMLGIFQIAYLAPVLASTGELPNRLLQPYWILWFLLSLIWWMLLLPLITRIPWALPISIAVSIGAGAIPDDGFLLSISRTLVFLPFFVAGQLYGKQAIAMLQSLSLARFAAVPLLIGCAAVIYSSGIDHRWLYGSFSFTLLGTNDLTGYLLRSGLLALATLSMFAFFACMPTAASWVSRIGQRSLAIFVLHGFVVKFWGAAFGGGGALGEPALLALLVIVSMLTTLVLAIPVFDKNIRSVTASIVAAPHKFREGVARDRR